MFTHWSTNLVLNRDDFIKFSGKYWKIVLCEVTKNKKNMVSIHLYVDISH